MKTSALEGRSIRVSIVKVILCLVVLLPSITTQAQEHIAVGRTALFDISADGTLLLQRDGFTASGAANTNLSVLNIATNTADPVNFDENGAFVSVTSASMSADGRYVAFQSGSRTLYLRDRQAGTSIRFLKTTDGATPNGDTAYPRVSADGRYIVFRSRATNLVNEVLPATSAFTNHMYIYDRVTDQTSLAARAHDGTILDAAFFTVIGLPQQQLSADGRYLVYVSPAKNAHPDTPANNTKNLLYRRDMQTGSVQLLSRDTSGNFIDGNYGYPMISDDGNRVMFTANSLAADLAPGRRATGIYMKDISSGKVTHMSETTDNSNVASTAIAGNFSSPLSMSGDGRHVAFNSTSQKLLAGNPGGGWAVFVSSVAEDGSVSMRRISMPDATQQQTSANEGTNPIMARTAFAIAFHARDRTVFFPGISDKEGDVVYRDSSLDGTPGGNPGGGGTPSATLPKKTTQFVDGRASSAVISGGVYTNQGSTLSDRATAPAHITIRTSIEPESSDIGQSVQFLVVVEVGGNFVTVNSSGAIVPFNEANLQFFASRPTMSAKEEFELFSGVLGTGDRATYNIFLGYLRSGDLNPGNIIFNAAPISIIIE